MKPRSAPRWHWAGLVCAAAACLTALPVHALELSPNAIANARNAVGQPLWAGTSRSPLVADVSEGTSPAPGPQAVTANSVSLSEPVVAQERGGASWYARHFQGRRTANGERYDQNELTAAHKTLPFGTVVRVRSEVNGKEVDVRINDRGPFVDGRVIDLSQAAARALGMLQLGVKKVTLLLPPALRPGQGSANLNQVAADGTLSRPGLPTPAPSARTINPSIR